MGLKANDRIVALELEGIVYGSPRLPKEAWRRMEEIFAPIRVEPSPLIHKPSEICNLSELARVRFPRSHQRTPMPYLPVNLRQRVPLVGEKVTALGFAGLDVDLNSKGEDRPLSQYLYEATGVIVEVIPVDPASTRPWPRIRVACHWPSGMSGGPILNGAGDVIAIVSTSFSGADESMGACFAGWNIPENVFPTLDPLNPGSFKGYGRLNHSDDVEIFVEHDPQDESFWHISHNPSTGGWISL